MGPDEIGFLIDELLEKYITAFLDSWEEFSTSFNAGQTSLYWLYVQGALTDYANDVIDNWPDTDVAEYENICYGAYEELVMERAFSEAIEAPVDEMDEILSEAQELQAMQEMLEIFG